MTWWSGQSRGACEKLVGTVSLCPGQDSFYYRPTIFGPPPCTVAALPAQRTLSLLSLSKRPLRIEQAVSRPDFAEEQGRRSRHDSAGLRWRPGSCAGSGVRLYATADCSPFTTILPRGSALDRLHHGEPRPRSAEISVPSRCGAVALVGRMYRQERTPTYESLLLSMCHPQ